MKKIVIMAVIMMAAVSGIIGSHIGAGEAHSSQYLPSYILASSYTTQINVKETPLSFKEKVDEQNTYRWRLQRAVAYVLAVDYARAHPIQISSVQHRKANIHSTTNVSSGGGSLDSIMACIRSHESGNYASHTRSYGASGAYQYEPSTWQNWSNAAGYSGYSEAYQAPSYIQDAVTRYTLTHGGAHNWDPRFGNDPCTVSMH